MRKLVTAIGARVGTPETSRGRVLDPALRSGNDRRPLRASEVRARTMGGFAIDSAIPGDPSVSVQAMAG